MPQRNGYCDLEFAKVDTARQKRRGLPEAIYCPGKTKEQILEISRQLLKNKQSLLLTKLEKDVYVYLKKKLFSLKYNRVAKIGFMKRRRVPSKDGLVAVVSAGTSDIPIAEEAAITLEVMGSKTLRIYDVGVAGIHRLTNNINTIRKATVVVVVAGMEGALASIVSGMVRSPVVAVPTSCGYGANFEGLSALLTMLNSCSPGIAVVNIDNGFGAGYLAHLINR